MNNIVAIIEHKWNVGTDRVNSVNLIGMKKVTETSKEKSFKKQESVGLTLAKVNKQDLEKERVTISKTKYPYISGFTKDMVLEMCVAYQLSR